MAVKKKILWVSHEANLSGANIAMLEYAAALKNVYHFHFILPNPGNMLEAARKLGYNATVVFQYGWAVPLQSGRKEITIRKRLRTAAAVFKTCIIAVINRCDAIFTNTQVPFTGSIAASFLGKSHVWWIHEFGEEDFGFRIGFGNKAFALRQMGKSKLIVCNSDAVRNKFGKLLPQSSVERIYQPVSTAFSLNKERPAKSGFLMFGQISPGKNHKEVIEALIDIKKTGANCPVLHIAGPSDDAEYLQELNEMVSVNDLSETVFIRPGYFVKEEVMPLYHCVIVSSRCEAFGRVIIEANRAGLKVIVKNSGGAPELVNETNGLIYNSPIELRDILSGKIFMPSVPFREPYSETSELARLKLMLGKII